MKNTIFFIVVAAALVWAYFTFSKDKAVVGSEQPVSPTAPENDLTGTLRILQGNNVPTPNAGVKWSNIYANMAAGGNCASLPPELRLACVAANAKIGVSGWNTKPTVLIGLSGFTGNGAMEYYGGLPTAMQKASWNCLNHPNDPGCNPMKASWNCRNHPEAPGCNPLRASWNCINHPEAPGCNAVKKPLCLILANQPPYYAGGVLPGVNCRMSGTI